VYPQQTPADIYATPRTGPCSSVQQATGAGAMLTQTSARALLTPGRRIERHVPRANGAGGRSCSQQTDKTDGTAMLPQYTGVNAGFFGLRHPAASLGQQGGHHDEQQQQRRQVRRRCAGPWARSAARRSCPGAPPAATYCRSWIRTHDRYRRPRQSRYVAARRPPRRNHQRGPGIP
jgi:hypothetical protein